MTDKYHEGICMMCHKSPIQVRHIDLYLIGSEGFWCCKACENEVLEFIREKRRKATQEAKQRWKERKNAKQ